MATVDFGSAVKLSWQDAPSGSTVSLEVTQPDGTQLLLSPVGAPPEFELAPTMSGRHFLRWQATGEATEAYTDQLDVWPEDPRFLISIDDAKNALNEGGRMAPDLVNDLRLYVAAATPVIEDIVGPVLTTTMEFKCAGDRSAIILPAEPSAITAVTLNGTALAGSEWFTEYGILYAGVRGGGSTFGSGELIVSFTVGRGSVPPNIRLGTRELVRHWWQIGKQSSGGAIRGQEAAAAEFTPSGFAVPRRVIELCAPHEQIGGFA
ncbi:hypothetical protein MB46_10380 [Arthrobacter alpinus]|uniref:hypothetical protein n=1 Tax=Arthrobacter alpinus TaxID=656366 RepID=UPI0005CA745A|nr:hypothetical protein [Arthrobacter alpinus]ALV45827.1 hypothetical protein MB46_10380 [Arthrobacter alpinus]